jgi:hypothetical protein
MRQISGEKEIGLIWRIPSPMRHWLVEFNAAVVVAISSSRYQ